ncbi:MAG: DUF1643 domain-containing protein [Actinomycetota bacterium]|nr:DUF1643 domain-containing protein [Actinomycetota bacterium]
MGGGIHRAADLSDCGTYRYALWRTWDPLKEAVLFVGLNPSTADAERDDPTIRKCVKFARSWGYGEIVMCNLFAFRATDPRELAKASARHGVDVVGPENEDYLGDQAEQAALVVAAWGNNPAALNRAPLVLPLLGPDVRCLGTTQDGHPRHPLYVRGETRPQPYRGCV